MLNFLLNEKKIQVNLRRSVPLKAPVTTCSKRLRESRKRFGDAGVNGGAEIGVTGDSVRNQSALVCK